MSMKINFGFDTPAELQQLVNMGQQPSGIMNGTGNNDWITRIMMQKGMLPGVSPAVSPMSNASMGGGTTPNMANMAAMTQGTNLSPDKGSFNPLIALAALGAGGSLLNANKERPVVAPAVGGSSGFSGKLYNPFTRR